MNALLHEPFESLERSSIINSIIIIWVNSEVTYMNLRLLH